MKLSKYFSKEELKCPCCGTCLMDADFLNYLDLLRKACGMPLRINSGFRCEKHNAELKDSKQNSLHLVGKAADIHCPPVMRWQIINAAIKIGFTGIGIGANFIHLDRSQPARIWVY